MSDLMSRLRTDQLDARKGKLAIVSALLTTLIGEASMVGKNDGNRETTDAEVIAVIKKFLKNNLDAQASLAGTSNMDAIQKLNMERVILESYLPTQIAGDRLRGIIESMKSETNAGPKDMGKIMALLKSRFDGQYDGREASSIVKQVLAG